MSTIIIPAMASSDCPMSEQSDPFAVGIIPNSFPPSIENEDSQESNPFDQLELSPNKRHALWRRNTVEYWNPWWRQVLNSSKSNDKFGYFSWTKAKRSTVWKHFEQGGISRMVLLRLSVRRVGRYLPTPSSELVAVVHLLFGAMLSIRNAVAQKLVKGYCRNLE